MTPDTSDPYVPSRADKFSFKFRSDPEVIGALAAAGVERLREPTLAGGETRSSAPC